MNTTDSTDTLKCRVAVRSRLHGDDDAQVVADRRELRVRRLRRHLLRELGNKPALTVEQRAGLAAILLHPAGAA